MFQSMFARKVFVLGALLLLTTVVALGWQGPSDVLAHGVVDQQFETNDHFLQIDASEPMGQEVTPAATTVIAVDVSLLTINEAGAADVTLLLRSGTIGGAVLASATRTLPQDLPPVVGAWIHYELPSAVAVTPGQTYVIELQSTNVSHAWHFGDGGYEGGSGIEDGAPSEDGKDFAFRTYAQEVASIKGDVDCDGVVNAVDALKVLRHAVALSVSQTEPCADIGQGL